MWWSTAAIGIADMLSIAIYVLGWWLTGTIVLEVIDSHPSYPVERDRGIERFVATMLWPVFLVLWIKDRRQ